MGKIIITVMIFLLIGALSIFAANDYRLAEKESRSSFFGDFGRWVYHLGNNMVEITGLVIDQSWLPDTTSKKESLKETQKSLVDTIINEVK